MPDLSIAVRAPELGPASIVPALRLELAITARPHDARIQALMLRTQVRIDPTARSYGAREREALVPVFGPEEEWSRTMHPLLWTLLSTSAPPFAGSAAVELLVPLTVDLLFGPARYLHALVDGVVPVRLLVEGTLFHEASSGALQVQFVPAVDLALDVPVETVRRALDSHTGGGVGLVIGDATFRRLDRLRAAQALSDWDQVIDRLIGERA